MLNHKKNCSKHVESIQHRYLDGGNNGQRRKLHRLWCPTCGNNQILSEKELNQWVSDHPLPEDAKA